MLQIRLGGLQRLVTYGARRIKHQVRTNATSASKSKNPSANQRWLSLAARRLRTRGSRWRCRPGCVRWHRAGVCPVPSRSGRLRRNKARQCPGIRAPGARHPCSPRAPRGSRPARSRLAPSYWTSRAKPRPAPRTSLAASCASPPDAGRNAATTGRTTVRRRRRARPRRRTRGPGRGRCRL
jgi:hypothetical protein